MEDRGNSVSSGVSGRGHYWLRVLRPLFWWLLLVLVLYGIRTHQRLMEQTRLLASVSLLGKDVRYEAETTLDGKAYDFGSKVSLGHHDLTIRCPKADAFQSNFFVWYRGRDLGAIQLHRSEGLLRITTVPSAPLVKIASPEWQRDVTNNPTDTLSVPTDTYIVQAVYPYFSVEKTVVVNDRQEVPCLISPDVGVLHVTAVYPGTQFELEKEEDTGKERMLEGGKLPVTLPILETGKYRLHVSYRNLKEDYQVVIASGETNTIDVDFPLGTVVLESTPAGATVRDGDGQERGMTPLTLEEVPAGVWRGEIERTNYLFARVELEVRAKQTTIFQTNLVKRSFALAMQRAWEAAQGPEPNYAAEIAALSDALQEEPGDAVLTAKLRRARVAQALVAAERKADKGDYAGAAQEAEKASVLTPENADIKVRIDGYKKTMAQEQAKAEVAKRRELADLRKRRPREFFTELMRKTADSGLFEEKEMIVRGNMNEVQVGIAAALGSGSPKFTLEANRQPIEEGFLIQAQMHLFSGVRRCYIVGGQTAEGEVTVYFRVFEYAYPDEINLLALAQPPSANLIPIHNSRLATARYQMLIGRRAEGVQIVTDRIWAVGK